MRRTATTGGTRPAFTSGSAVVISGGGATPRKALPAFRAIAFKGGKAGILLRPGGGGKGLAKTTGLSVRRPKRARRPFPSGSPAVKSTVRGTGRVRSPATTRRPSVSGVGGVRPETPLRRVTGRHGISA